jgi:undecaprenyl-diphosphatase
MYDSGRALPVGFSWPNRDPESLRMTYPSAARRILSRVWRTEFAMLLAMVLVAGIVGAFIALASEVVEGDTRRFDEAILVALRTPGDLADPIGPFWVELMMKDITSLGGTTVLTILTIAAGGYAMVKGRRRMAIFIILAVAGGAALSNSLKLLFSRPRPDLVGHGVDVFTMSFPSGHAMLSAVTYLTLGTMLARMDATLSGRTYIMCLATFLTIVIGASRVYLGVHYPTDVLAGWVLGAAWAILCLLAAWLMERRQNGRGDASEQSF